MKPMVGKEYLLINGYFFDDKKYDKYPVGSSRAFPCYSRIQDRKWVTARCVSSDNPYSSFDLHKHSLVGMSYCNWGLENKYVIADVTGKSEEEIDDLIMAYLI